jgi:hypothetical protein
MISLASAIAVETQDAIALRPSFAFRLADHAILIAEPEFSAFLVAVAINMIEAEKVRILLSATFALSAIGIQELLEQPHPLSSVISRPSFPATWTLLEWLSLITPTTDT